MSEQQGAIYSWPHDRPLDLAATLAQLRQSALLPDEASWWFGWNELEIALPCRLQSTQEPDTRWDVVHVFSPQAELRWVRQGRARRGLLLMEAPLPAGLASWGQAELYQAIPALRPLWGGRLRLPEGERRGVVAFPRPLDYGIAESAASYASALVADVYLYQDAEARLRTVRYTRLRHMSPDDPAGRVRPYADGMQSQR